MNVLWKCCKRSLIENKSRTIVTILGVALATALITAVGCMGTSFLKSEAEYLKKGADWHARFTGVSKEDLKYFENNQAFENVWYVKRAGYGRIVTETSGIPYLEMLAPEKDFYDHNRIALKKGRLPEKEGEIVISKVLRTDKGLDVKIGDEIQVEIGDRAVGGQLIELGMPYVSPRNKEMEQESLLIKETKTFKIVGMIEGGWASSLMARRSGSSLSVFKAFYYDDREGDCYDVYVRYTKNSLGKHEEVDSAILGITTKLLERLYFDWTASVSEEERFQATRHAKDYEFNDLLAGMESPGLLIRNYYAMIGLVILVYLFVIYAGVFCINNSFDLSFTERIRFYGMLSSVGTTKRQKRKIVWMEALSIACIGIPIGILIGIALTSVLVGVVNVAVAVLRNDLGFHMIFRLSVAGILISVVVSVLMVILSAMESALRASRIMPINAIRMNDFISSDINKKVAEKKTKRNKTPVTLRKLFGSCGVVAYQNYRRSKRKYQASITSITISVALVIGLCFMGMLFDVYKEMITSVRGNNDWQIIVYAQGTEQYEAIKEINKLPEVTDSLCVTSAWVNAEEGSIPYLEGIQSRKSNSILVYVLDDQSFQKLCEDAGISQESAKGKVIMDSFVDFSYYDLKQNNREIKISENTADFSGLRELSVRQPKLGEKKGEIYYVETKLEIAGQLDRAPVKLSNTRFVLSAYADQSWYEKNQELSYEGVTGFYCSEDADALESEIEDMELFNASVDNFDHEIKSNRLAKTLVMSMLGGFIVIIFLIGVTNVINAVNTNMELRTPEYAKLLALGMTRRQFRGMLWVEGLIIAGKGLIYGLLIGYGISYALYRFFWEVDNKQFEFAWRIPIAESLAAIFVVAFMMITVLRYGSRKLQKKNLIETMRGENI